MGNSIQSGGSGASAAAGDFVPAAGDLVPAAGDLVPAAGDFEPASLPEFGVEAVVTGGGIGVCFSPGRFF